MMDLSSTGVARAPGTVLFGPGWRGGVPAAFRSPCRTFTARTVEEVLPALEAACAAAESGAYVAGFVAYEAAPAFDEAFATGSPTGFLVWMGAYESPADPSPGIPSGATARAEGTFSMQPHEYARRVDAVRLHICEGDVYQVNVTGPLDVVTTGDPVRLFRRLMARQPVPFGAYVDTGEAQVVSCSPELFFDRSGAEIVTRPMKGTVRRGRREEEDAALEEWLRTDEKSRAENLMIVDLLRNDLSRCCTPGSVHAAHLFTTERYETVIQMTSEVRGRLRPGCSTPDVFRSLFPCGSVTGAPKIRAMELISRYERGPRGVYCGAVGFMHRDRAVFNVAIRTLTLRGGSGRLGIGSGIVWDSDATSEYEECLLKARFLTDGADDPVLIETMRAEGGRIPFLSYHVGRMASSAAALGYAFDAVAFRDAVCEAIPGEAAWKIRATLAPDGAHAVEREPLAASPDAWTAVLADERIDSEDLYRRHKTSRRAAYERAYRQARATGYDEVLFLNERGEVAEGSRSNIVAHFGDRRVTPPVESGALPGVYRRHLIESGQVKEGILRPTDLYRADRLFLCNAVRGLVRAQVVLAPDVVGRDVTDDAI